ncbi:hypothetical protein PC129_g4727 [Phytophthora cactorum]|uniref:Reverse transcriptase domain-containing protein n=1 Tax=Phytophthora cactorum TaxID=29920 RepID=A0A329RDR0_9STRA|nr:hypothetical protein PC111_g22002 [Phytophthora cactorum]KAG2875102.1 hypothetical protein PC114_g24921 [Phytophthora cactorum]KAG2881784.1 hypothetical protein PC115_g22118 [Phytophthora cactorum]KAG2890822.1 hypothetical protein PC117_g24379 [Phytophthora cactorum]KAG2960941.1 hypothetical protein PC118_g22238 [Phytophthora cactorum]
MVERDLPRAVELEFLRVVERELPDEADTVEFCTRRASASTSSWSSQPSTAPCSITRLSRDGVRDYVLIGSATSTLPCAKEVEVTRPPCDAEEITKLPGLSWKLFLRDVKHGEIGQVCMLVAAGTASIAAVHVDSEDPASDARTRPKEAEPKSAREARYAAQLLPALEASGNPVAPLVREFIDILPDKVPAALPPDHGVRHEIDLVPGATYCVTRQWPFPVIKSRRSMPSLKVTGKPTTFAKVCPHTPARHSVLRKRPAGGGSSTPSTSSTTPPSRRKRRTREDMVLDSMSGSTTYSAIDLMDGFYQILMREDDVPFTAVSTPSGIVWQWLVMRQHAQERPSHLQSHGVQPVAAIPRLRAQLLR